MTAPLHSPSPSSVRRPWWRRLGVAVLWVVIALLNLWAIGALWFDFPVAVFLRPVVAILYAVAAIFVVRRGGAQWKRMIQLAGTFLVVLVMWLSLRPSNDRRWQPDVAQTAWAEVNGDVVTLHNVRNCEYRTEMDYTPRWETRAVNLSRLRGIDIAINYWGSAWMAHPVISFQFEDVPPVCFSIETRKEDGESYSAIGGLYRQFELICVCADERDVIRVRTNFRRGEDVYLYRTKVAPEQARQRFLEYVSTINALHSEPRWYNAVTTNCTTGIRTQHAPDQRVPWDWRILLNGYADEMLYEHGALAGDLPFPELKRSALINKAAQAAGTAPDFSQQIRAGRPGFNP
ncbi:MAG TPA: DUF4105 domain-containing protein [Verrucomicrobiales bacterium]|nr:DUF4105 domain-containing protein [Verrucomicrobiales bacterium]